MSERHARRTLLEVPGVDVDELVDTGRQHGREVLHAAALAVAQRTRSQAVSTARTDLLNGLATDLAKGIVRCDGRALAGGRTR